MSTLGLASDPRPAARFSRRPSHPQPFEPFEFHQDDALMCGYCTPGFVTACKAFLDKHPNATEDEIRKGIDANICRCGTYVGVLAAAQHAARAMKGA